MINAQGDKISLSALVAVCFSFAWCVNGNPAAWLQDEKSGIFSNEKAGGAVKSVLPAFRYAGKAFDPAAWENTRRDAGVSNNAAIAFSEFVSPDKKLKLTVETRVYQDYPVTELRPTLETLGNGPTEILDEFQSLVLRALLDVRGVRIRTVTGSQTVYTDFSRRDTILMGRHQCDTLSLSTAEGRSSANWLPYFGVDFAEKEGVEVALGWTGNWKTDFRFDGKKFTLTSGVQTSHFRMVPGERFLMPTILLYSRRAQTRRDAAVQFHRFLVSHKAPRDANGNLSRSLLSLTVGGGNKTDENMLKIIGLKKRFPGVDFDTLWVDANWYGPARDEPQPPNCANDWWTFVGDWRVNTKTHPTGTLKPVSDAAHAAGMKFLVWFEAERCVASAPIRKVHPEYFLPSDDQYCYLVNLGDPVARNYIFETVSEIIRTSGIDIYRQDFNMDPSGNWRKADTADRQGITEIKYINGLWMYWDALRTRFHSMLLENCASGGRRMDFEMMSRSHSYCRDDAHMSPHPEELCQNITLNSTAYIPFAGGETFTIAKHDDYGFLSCVAAGTVFTPTDFGFLFGNFTDADVEWFNRMYTLADRVRPFFQGDFYALTEPAFDSSEIWCAYQLDNPTSKAGFFIAFRRAKCEELSLALNLGGIDPAKDYELEIIGQKGKKTVKGADLAHYTVTLPQARSFQMVFYTQK